MREPGRHLHEHDLAALAIGAALLGTGGGGNPYIGSLRTRDQLRRHGPLRIIRLADLPDDALVASVGGIGAPVVGIEKFEQGEECLRALQALEAHMGVKVDALIAAEMGGANSMEPLLTAAQAGLPVVDGDGMGRAFPEVQMCTYFIYGHEATPAAMADEKGNIVLYTAMSDATTLERHARATCVVMGAAAGMANRPMSGRYVKEVAVPDTLTLALNIGRAVLAARRDRTDPVEAVLQTTPGKRIFNGKVVDVHRELKGGFAVGEARLTGSGPNDGDDALVNIQNENLLFQRNGNIEITVPDLIVIVEADTAEPITTEQLRYGQRVEVLALPCHPLLRTAAALEYIGPAAFGYPDVAFQPLEIPDMETP